ncbi:MAG: uncharacterized protein QOD54_601 [Sphingomonadales bacterium]|jgi:uncharacterized protein YdbL (DUF1318 family)|nr:uncharacterized protein [Sphingomonadales bacterium]
MKPPGWLFGLALLAGGATASAQPAPLALAIRAGQVGERFDGYMGFVVPPSPEVRRQVAAVNLRRRNLYIELAGRRNVNPAVVGVATGCQLLRQLSPGEAYLLPDGKWRRWTPGQQAPVPEQCG